MAQSNNQPVNPMETFPSEAREMPEGGAEGEKAPESGQVKEPEKTSEERLAEDIMKRVDECDNDALGTFEIEGDIFNDEHKSIKIIDSVFGKLGDAIPLPPGMDQDKQNLQSEFTKVKDALKDMGELSNALERDGRVVMDTKDLTQIKKDQFERVRALAESMKEKVKEFIDGVKKGLEERAKDNKEDMVYQIADMSRMQAMFDDLFRNVNFVANRWDEAHRKQETISHLKDGLGKDVEDIKYANIQVDVDKQNISTRLAQGQDESTRGALDQDTVNAVAAATENK